MQLIDKLNSIVAGWSGYIWETPEIKAMAEKRAVECATCDNAQTGLIAEYLEDEVKQIEGMECGLCSCPLSTLLRSKNEKCKLGKW